MAAFCAAMLALQGCAAFMFGNPPPKPTAPVAAPLPPAPPPAPSTPAAVAIYATGADDSPRGDVLVYLRAADGSADPAKPAPAALDLMQRSFEPKVLVVPVGTVVTVHNLDDVNHDLYSFSPALSFSLHLPAKVGSGTVTATRAGLVVLGCKVHDEMVGYLYVTDAPYFGKTDANGYLRLAGLKPGRYLLGLWQPGTPVEDQPRLRPLTLAAGAEEAVRLRF